MYLDLRKAVLTLPVLIIVLALLNIPIASAATIVDKQREIERIQEEIAKSKSTLNRATSNYQNTLSEVQTLDTKIRANESELARAQDKVATLKERLSKRIVYMHKTGPINFLSVLAFSDSFRDFIIRARIIAYVIDQDSAMIEKTKTLEVQLTQYKIELADARKKQSQRLAVAEKKRSEIYRQLSVQNTAVKKLNYEIAALKRAERARLTVAKVIPRQTNRAVSRGSERISGFVFPVAGAYSYIDSWGFARSGGRRHQGTDIMAGRGTPVVACVSGVIDRTTPSSSGLGGITIWLNGNDGNTYYYAHLNSIALGITWGTRVGAGQVIGTVGSTGNASEGSPHLHFEIHPGGGSATNPYPILKRAE